MNAQRISLRLLTGVSTALAVLAFAPVGSAADDTDELRWANQDAQAATSNLGRGLPGEAYKNYDACSKRVQPILARKPDLGSSVIPRVVPVKTGAQLLKECEDGKRSIESQGAAAQLDAELASVASSVRRAEREDLADRAKLYEQCLTRIDAVLAKAPDRRSKPVAPMLFGTVTAGELRSKCEAGIGTTKKLAEQAIGDAETRNRKGLDSARAGRNNGLEHWRLAKEAVRAGGPENLQKAGDKYKIALGAFNSVAENLQRMFAETPRLEQEAIPSKTVKATWGDLLKTVRTEVSQASSEYQAIGTQVSDARKKFEKEYESGLRAAAAGDRGLVLRQHGVMPGWDRQGAPEYNAARAVKAALAAPVWRFAFSRGSQQCDFAYQFSGDRLVSKNVTPGCTP